MRQTLYRGARNAIRLARECERDAAKHSGAWRQHLLIEAARHRDRADWYLMMRRRIDPQTEEHRIAA